MWLDLKQRILQSKSPRRGNCTTNNSHGGLEKSFLLEGRRDYAVCVLASLQEKEAIALNVSSYYSKVYPERNLLHILWKEV